MIEDPNIQFVIKKPLCDGIGNVMKSYITAFSVNPNSKIDCNPEYALGVYDTVLDKQHIFDTNTDCRVEYMYTSRLLVLPEEDDVQQHIFSEENYEVNGCGNLDYNYLYSFTRLIDYNYDIDKIAKRVKDRIIGTIRKIKFLPEIMDEVYKNLDEPVLTYGKTLGISVRTWKCFHERDINRKYDSETYKNKIREVIENYPDIEKIFISFDNHDYEEEYMDFLKEFKYKTIKVLRKSENINELQHAFIKMLTLSKCDHFIGNRISTFSELVWWFNGCNIKCHMLF
jgi:hypothetical protein